MVVLHRKVTALVVEGYARIDVMRRVDVDLAVKHVGGRIRGVDVLDQRLRNGPGTQFDEVDISHGGVPYRV
jgi:hypothetical protein